MIGTLLRTREDDPKRPVPRSPYNRCAKRLKKPIRGASLSQASQKISTIQSSLTESSN